MVLVLAGMALSLIGTQAAEVTITIGEPQGVVRRLLGVNAGPTVFGPTGRFDLTSQYRKYGVAQVRTHDFYGPLDMSVMYPDQEADPDNPASYNFGESDRAFRAILDGGFEPYLRIGDSWNIGSAYGTIRRRAPVNRANWIRAAVYVVRHYRKMAGEKLRYVEIWNEPNHPRFWDSSMEEFARLFADTVTAIKAAFPDLKVGGPGFAHSALVVPGGKRAVTAFLEGIAGRCKPDFFSWHVYTNRPEDVRDHARYYRAELDKHGFKNIPQHLTEYHTDEHNRPDRISVVELRAGAPAAAIVTGIWIAMQMEGLEEATLYRGSDMAPDQMTFYGMLRSDGTPKGPGLAFEFWSRMAAARERRRATLTGADPTAFWCLAGTSQDGKVQLLLANVSMTPVRWTVRVTGNAASGMLIEEIRSHLQRSTVLRAPGLSAITPGYTAQLVTIGAGAPSR